MKKTLALLLLLAACRTTTPEEKVSPRVAVETGGKESSADPTQIEGHDNDGINGGKK